MRRPFTLFSVALALAAGFTAAPAIAQDEKPAQSPTYTTPPELTTVTGHLVGPAEQKVGGGIAYFFFQNRLMELPHENPMEKVKAMSEKTVAVDQDGSFTVSMAPGNYTMVYDPTADNSEIPGPGPESMAVAKRMSREQIDARIAAIRENAEKGLPIQDGKLGEAYVVENRYVRPPLIDFGNIQLQDDNIVVINARDDKAEPIKFPAALRLRGRNGDIMEPHSPSVSEAGRYAFYDLFPQTYQVFALGTRPRPGTGDDITTPTIKDDSFVFDGTPLEHQVVVVPGRPGDNGAAAAPPPPPAGAAPARSSRR